MNSANDPAIVEAVDELAALCTALRISDYCVCAAEEHEYTAEDERARAALFAAIDARANRQAQAVARMVASAMHAACSAQTLNGMDIARGVAHLTEAMRLCEEAKALTIPEGT